MGIPQRPHHDQPIDFDNLIKNYAKLQNRLLLDVKRLAEDMSSATPGRFLLIQFQMAQVTQIGETISNLVAQINTLINAAIRNQKSQ